MEWQTIDTAPKDGTKLLLYFPEYDEPIQVGYYAVVEKIENGKVIERDEYWKGKWMEYKFIRSCSFSEDNPTHWMPVPEPPAKSAYDEYLERMRDTREYGLPELREDISKEDRIHDTCLDALRNADISQVGRWTPEDFKRNEELFKRHNFPKE